MSLPSPPRCILNGGHFVHPCFRCFFNLELRTSVQQTLGSISLWSLAYSNQFQTCCAGVCFSGWAVRAEIQKLKKKVNQNPAPPKKINKSRQHQEWKHWWISDLLIYSTFWKGSKRIKALICLKPLLACANNVQKKFDSLCAGSAPHFPDFWCPTSVCPSLPRPSSLCSLLLYRAKWILTGPGATTTGALWLLQFSHNFSEVRTRTIARSFRWNQMASSFFSFRLWPPSTLRKPRSS